MPADRPFFIGWESKPPKSLSVFTGFMGMLALVGGVGIAGLVAALQGNIGTGTWNLEIQTFRGLFVKSPTSMLVAQDEAGNLQVHYLVSEFKFGFPEDEADKLHLQMIEFEGTLIDDGTASMIEVVNGSVTQPGAPPAHRHPFEVREAGTITLSGEVVDSKCYLGVMNPGIRKTHRACAINCIRGGVPPVLLAESDAGETSTILLLGSDGEPINQEILDYVAEPIEISGNLRQEGPILVLRSDLSSIRRL